MKLGGRSKKRSKESVRHRVGSDFRDELQASTAANTRRASASVYQATNLTNVPRRYTIASDNSSVNEQKKNISALPAMKLFDAPPIRLAYPTNASLPKKHKAKILVWSDLTVDAIDRLNESLNPEYVKNVLAKIFFLDNWKENTKTGIVMDLYYHTLQFAREQNFTREKTSTFFSIIKEIFQVCIETPFGNLDHTFLYFKDLLHCHAVNHPPYSIELFTPSELRKISEYTVNTFFRHFKMYKYAFTAQIRLDLNFSYDGMPTPETQSEESIFVPKTPEEEPEQITVTEKEEEDEDVLKAKEELKNLVKNFLTEEAKKIEGKVEDQINSAVEALNSKIDPYLTTTGKQETKGKKK